MHPSVRQTVLGRRLFHFYVDSVAGDDSRGGRSEANAVKTLAAAQAATLARGNGTRIGLKCGSEWRDRLHLDTLDQITVDSWGDPALGPPVIRCDDILSGTWQTSSDRADANTAVYSRSFTHVGASNWLAFWENGTRLEWASSLASCQSTAGSFFITGANVGLAGGTVTLYVHPFGDTNPNSDGKTYEGTTRDVAIDARDDSIIRHVHGRRAAGQYGALQLRDNALIERCLGEDGTRHDILVASGTIRRCVGWILHRDSRTDKISLEGFAANAAGKTVTWDTCVAVSATGTTFQENGIGGHTSGTPYDEWSVINCSVKGCMIGAAGNVTKMTITRAKLDHGRIKHTGTGASAALSIIDPYFIGIATAAGAAFSLQPLGCVWSIDGLRTYINEAYSQGFIVPQTNTNPGTITGSVIVDGGGTAQGRRRMIYGDAATNWTSTLNVFKTTGVNTIGNEPYVYWNNPGAMHNGDNNVYHATNASFGMNFIINSTTYNTIAAYFTAVRPTRDANSVNADPGVTDPANGDFRLTGIDLPPGIGLQRDPTCQNYTPIPADLTAAKAWLLAA